MRALVVAVILGWASVAAAQFGPKAPQARLQLEGREAYAGMPFGVAVVAEGFDEQPAPAQPTLSIPGATVTPLGVEPHAQRIVVNGRRFESVTWVFRWRVEAPRAGEYKVGDVTVVQGSKKATASGGAVRVTAIEATDDMKLQLALPERPVWLGEVVPVELQWLLRRDVQDQQLSVPILSMPGELVIGVPEPADPRQVLEIPAGASSVELPFTRDEAVVDGKRYTRFRFAFTVTPQRAGAIAIPPAQVVAALEVGRGRDSMGFPTTRTQLFSASDVARTLDVRPLPQSGRPASFAGAVGSSFSIATRTSRSVVQLGEPVDLEITVKGDTRLDGLALGSLAGPGRLPADRFAMPDVPPPGELAPDGKTKTFRVPVQVTDPATTEIPPIELAWFDPAAGEYRTTRSEPIALSVKGGAVVGAGDVVGGRRPAPAPATGAATADVSLVGADLALSAPGAALDRPLGGTTLWILVALLYAVPLSVLGFRWWRVRTAARREEAGEVTAARRRVDAELERARTAPARDAAGPLVAALRGLARASGRDAVDPLLARLETEAFAPGAAERPLADELRRDVAELARRWASRAAAIVFFALALAAPVAHAAPGDLVAQGRAAYDEAMAATDPTARQAAFARAADAFAAAAREAPTADLHADWGNAALGAADFGTATLAFRRALALDGDHGRASRNLAWLRTRLPPNLRPADGGATATLFFFHRAWTRTTRVLVGAAAFALAALLLVPWRRRPSGGRVALALVPALVWLTMLVSVLVDRPARADAVVLDAQLLRSADSPGAPAALATPLPPGTELTLLEQRPGWSRVRLPSGTTGWLPAPSVATVH